MLYNKEFLLQLDKQKNKVIYGRITALTFEESPIEYIEGRVTQGSINIDGASSVRRSCSLTIAAQNFNFSDYNWGLNTKFKLEIGVENQIDSAYPKIIWFKQGTYLITSFNISRNTTNFSITIQGKDKMCLLNGEVGGSLESSVDFGTIEEENINGIWTIRKIAIPEIIKNLVHTYAREPYHNIIINDLETYGLELLEYRYDTPLFLYRKPEENVYENALLDGGDTIYEVYNADGTFKEQGCLKKLSDTCFESLVDTLINLEESPRIKIENKLWCVARINYGQTAGYRLTDLIYPGDLIANVGESITSVLDKIKAMLTEFEYFYNLDGQFVFQKKQAIKETIWQFDKDESFVNEGTALTSAHAYEFHGGEFVTAFGNNPNLLNLKNDYSIWGEREGISGIKIPVHLRYAIDKKPIRYNRIFVDYGSKTNPGADYEAIEEYNTTYDTHITGQDSALFSVENVDWREIIYQMALDYYKYNFLDDFELKVAEANPIDYPNGHTGYEQYYIDLYSFWRELYYPNYESLFDVNGNLISYSTIQTEIDNLTKELYTGNNLAYDKGIENDLIALNNGRVDLINKWWDGSWQTPNQNQPKYNFFDDHGNRIYDSAIYLGMLNDYYFRKKNELETKKYQLEQEEKKYGNLEKDDYYTSGQYKNWNRKVYEAPDQLNFWFDFLDGDGELSQFSANVIGARSKSVNDTNIKSIYFRETPSVIYGTDKIVNEEGFRYIQANDIDHMFACSAQGKSAKDKLNELIYQHSYCIENATITSIPIYYLEPNVRIYVHDEEAGLDGDYIISKLTIPLNYNGTMTITATKAAENIL